MVREENQGHYQYFEEIWKFVSINPHISLRTLESRRLWNGYGRKKQLKCEILSVMEDHVNENGKIGSVTSDINDY